jgi:K+-transporting ATPase ATPase C chain
MSAIKTNDPIQNLLNQAPRRQPFAQLRAALLALGLFTLITGGVYPLLVTGLSQLFFPFQANGSLLRDAAGQVRGSRLLAQDFAGEGWFQARPSAVAYAASASGASNLAITSKKQAEAVATRQADWASRFGAPPAPVDMLYASGSGLDPEISRESALAQLDQVAAAHQLDMSARDALRRLIETLSQKGLPGEPPRVNVVDLNFALLNGFQP